MDVEERIKELGLKLPPAPKAGGVYHPVLRQGNLIHISGQGPVKEDGSLIIGKIGRDINKKAGKAAARQAGLTILSTIKAHYGPLDQVVRLIRLFGMVNCITDFEEQPFVINGCSELFASIWGDENGVGARSSVGMGSLPGNIPVEIEATFEVI